MDASVQFPMRIDSISMSATKGAMTERNEKEKKRKEKKRKEGKVQLKTLGQRESIFKTSLNTGSILG